MHTVVQDDLMLPELFDALPESVILFTPVMNYEKVITDFEIAYCNNASCTFLQAPKHNIIGQTVLQTALVSEDYAKMIFEQCLRVWQTGKPHEDEIDKKHLGRHFSALRSKTRNGVISVTRDRSDYFNLERERQEQSDRFTRILNASADGVMILQAVRNEANEITDFLLTNCNEATFDLAKISPGSVGKNLLEILPHLKNSEQFDLHKKVVESGLPEKIETTFRNENGEEYGWFIVSLMKMGDSVVSNFIDISDKKSNAEKIEDQADLLNGILEASINGIFACEAVRDEAGEIIDLKVIKINRAFTQMTGITAAGAEGGSYHCIFPSGRKSGMFSSYRTVIQTGQNFRKELFYDDESIIGWYDISAVKRGNNGIVITFTDITESKVNKQAIEDGSRYLQDVIDSSQTGIALLSPVRNLFGEIEDFKFKTVNQTLAALAGKHPSELVDKLYNEVFTASTANGIFDRYKKIAEGKVKEERFEMHYTSDKIDIWCDTLVKKRKDDLLVTFLDFTPLKKLQVEIASAAKRLNSFINNASAGMFTLSPVFNSAGDIDDFRFQIVNQAVATYIGEKAENLTGALGSIYFPAYKTNGLFNIYKDTFVNNASHRFDFHYEDGYDVYLDIQTVKAGNEILVTFTDQTNLKKLQVQLESSIKELKKSNASLEEFAYAASHDLQEPLRKINYFSERLRKGIGQKLTEDENRMFERMENAATRMSLLINDLLTYSQVSRSTRTFGTTDLTEILQQVLSDLETAIIEKKATVTTDKLAEIQGDPVQLRQLFQNLISNSLKYSKKEIPPVISVNCTVITKQVQAADKKFYAIQITDNGIGFEQEHAEKIFKVFQRLHGQSEFPGTGIGLAIVQKVVENHHGSISATSRLGEGSTFTVLFPEG